MSSAPALLLPSAVLLCSPALLSSHCTALSEIHSPVTACKAERKTVLQGVWNELSCREQGRDALVSLRRLALKQNLLLWLRQGRKQVLPGT